MLVKKRKGKTFYCISASTISDNNNNQQLKMINLGFQDLEEFFVIINRG